MKFGSNQSLLLMAALVIGVFAAPAIMGALKGLRVPLATAQLDGLDLQPTPSGQCVVPSNNTVVLRFAARNVNDPALSYLNVPTDVLDASDNNNILGTLTTTGGSTLTYGDIGNLPPCKPNLILYPRTTGTVPEVAVSGYPMNVDTMSPSKTVTLSATNLSTLFSWAYTSGSANATNITAIATNFCSSGGEGCRNTNVTGGGTAGGNGYTVGAGGAIGGYLVYAMNATASQFSMGKPLFIYSSTSAQYNTNTALSLTAAGLTAISCPPNAGIGVARGAVSCWEFERPFKQGDSVRVDWVLRATGNPAALTGTDIPRITVCDRVPYSDTDGKSKTDCFNAVGVDQGIPNHTDEFTIAA